MDVSERIEKHIERVPESGCWIWTGRVTPHSGHGRMRYNGASHPVHRVSYAVFKGDVPATMWVLHKCDVPCCVNPDHLYLGTPLDNARDRMRRGKTTGRSGEQHAHSKLTTLDVLAIRASTDHETVIAARFEVTRENIHAIRCRKTWRHIAEVPRG